MSYKEKTKPLIEWYVENHDKLNYKQWEVVNTMDYVSSVNIRFETYDDFIEYINKAVEIMEG